MGSITKGLALPGLDNFARTWLQPTAVLFRDASSEMEWALATSTFLECCQWLDLFVDVGICPAFARSKLVQKFFWKVEVPYQLLENLAIWPQHVIEGVRRLHSGVDLSPPVEFGDAKVLRTVVQLSSSAAGELAFSDAGKAFASLLLFSNPAIWESFLGREPDPAALAHAMSGRADPWLDGNYHLVYAGLIRTIEQMKGLLHLLQDSRSRYAPAATDDWVIFKEAVVAAHGWRLLPRSGGALAKLDVMVKVLDQLVEVGLGDGSAAKSPGPCTAGPPWPTGSRTRPKIPSGSGAMQRARRWRAPAEARKMLNATARVGLVVAQ